MASEAPGARRRTAIVAAIAVSAVALILIGVRWLPSDIRGTDDAFVDADIVAVASEVSGRVQSISVKDNSLVRAGQPLVQIAADDLRLKLDEAVAMEDTAKAQRDQLPTAGSSAAKRAADASLRAASARAAQVRLALAKTSVLAPIDGYVARRVVSVGAFVQPGQPLLAIVSRKVWVTANFKETELDGVRPGALADLTIDAFPGVALKGRVDSLQRGSGQAFALLPPENASGNFVKVVQRVPVRIELEGDPGQPLAPGLSARVRVHVR